MKIILTVLIILLLSSCYQALELKNDVMTIRSIQDYGLSESCPRYKIQLNENHDIYIWTNTLHKLNDTIYFSK